MIKDYTLTLMVLIIMPGCQLQDSHSASVRPNILIFLTDDMGYGDVGISGNTIIETPNLDQLAGQSVQFKNFYVSPVCAPTRASLLTGRYHQRTGVRSVTNGYETMDPHEITLAEILKEQGYRTGIFGKWHLGEYYPSVPNAQGFDEYLGFRTGHTNYYYDATIERNGQPFKTSGHITDVLTHEALKFMSLVDQHPFFCYLAYNAPHTPLQVDSSWWKGYAAAGLAEREARIHGMIEHLDQGIGKIISALKSQGILDNTILIFMSDNGPINGWRVPLEEMRYNAGLPDQKFTVYDGGVRTQCYWKWGNRWQPAIKETIAAHIDVLPTLVDILGIELPGSHPPVDGTSLVPVLAGQDHSLEARTLFQKYSLETLQEPAPFPGGIARKGDWKLVNGNELYNLRQDIGEQTNLADQHPDILAELDDEYQAWYRDISDDHNLQQIPITVGHEQENPVYLQPHHGKASGNVRFWGNRGLTGERRGTHPVGVDSDWTGEWQAKGDALEWQVSFVESGEYTFKIVARDTSRQQLTNLNLLVNDQVIAEPPTFSLNGEWNEYDLVTYSISEGPVSLKLILEGDTKNNLEVQSLVIEKQPVGSK